MSGRGGESVGRRSDSRRGQPSRGSPYPAGALSSRVAAPAAGQARGRGHGGSGGGHSLMAATRVAAALSPAADPAAPSLSTPPSAPAPVRVESPSAALGSSSAGDLTKEMDKLAVIAAVNNIPPSSSKAVKFPPRPGFGNIGSKVVIRANHFLVEVADKALHHYDVSISPEVTSKKINKDIIKQLIRLYGKSHLGNRKPAYDGRKSIYTAGPLPFSSKDFVVKLLDETSGSLSVRVRRESQFNVTIKFASKPNLEHLRQYLQSRQFDSPQETLQVLDVVLRELPSNVHTVVGRSFFSHELGSKGDIGDGLEYWRGYYQSLRPTQMGLSLNIDVSARAFYEPIYVTDFIKKYFSFRDLSRPLIDQDRLKVKRALKGIKVQVTHSGHPRSYRVSGISNQPASQITFTSDDQVSTISIIQYFRNKYKITLQYPALPALQTGTDRKPVYLPMELCKIIEGQRFSRKLNERQVSALLKATCQRPRDRERNIEKMVKNNNFNDNELVNKEFGIQVCDQLTMVNARVLPPPVLKYHDTGKERSALPATGQWNMMNKKMVNGGRVEHWALVNFSTRINPQVPDKFCEQLINMCINKGMAFKPNPLIPHLSANPRDIESTLTNIKQKATTSLASVGRQKDRLQLLIIILPDVTGSYGKIKRVCETELGIVSQCCKPNNATRGGIQYLENVALKINVKVGGRNTVLNDAIQRRIPLVSDRPTIIFGADVTHPQPGEDSSPSIAAVVASMDWPEVTKYRGLVSAQPHREEIIKDLFATIIDPQRGERPGGMIRELLISFYRSTGQKPHRIIFYRDGVSEGQFKEVLLEETDAIRRACATLEEGYLPPVTFVVVQKRHHTRLFPDHNRRDQMDKSGNILPGTIVDTKICHPTDFDFYLNSHAGIQGTSRPTHYHVLLDENKFPADTLQRLTNSLCYTYARCTRSVSIVPPAYYAHLAAFRARYYIEGEVHDGSSSSGRNPIERAAPVFRPLPQTEDNVKDVMFFC